MIRLDRALIALAVTGLLACGDDPTPPEPVPGDLLVTVVSPNGAEAAAVLETADAGIVSVSADDAQLFHWRAGGLSRVVVLLDQAGPVRFRLSVEDLNQPPRLRIVEVADASNTLRPSLAGYNVTAEPLIGI